MKKVLIIVLTLFFIGCSKKDCEVRKANITTRYQQMIAQAYDTWDGVPNYKKIRALEIEMRRSLANACN